MTIIICPHLYDGDGEEGDGEERDPEQVSGEDHAGHVGQDEEEGGHQPGQDQPAGVLGGAVHQHHAREDLCYFVGL